MGELEAEERICLDTDFLIDFKLGRKKAVDLVRELEQYRKTLATTDINAFELYYGAYKSRKKEQNLLEAKNTLAALIRLSLDDGGAELAAKSLAYLEVNGQAIEMRDLLIGCIAFQNGYALLTGNVSHFKRIRGLRVIPFLRS